MQVQNIVMDILLESTCTVNKHVDSRTTKMVRLKSLSIGQCVSAVIKHDFIQKFMAHGSMI